MSDSLHSELFPTELSQPVIVDLDDHRFQPTSLPRANTMESGNRPTTRRGTVGSAGEHLDVAQGGSSGDAQAIQWDDLRTRNFPENAIDDTRSVASQDGRSARHGSLVGRRGTFRRVAVEPGSATKSRASSKSSRSESPPNSVDAFAGARRRERTNTLHSRQSSDMDLSHDARPLSTATHHGRRPTVTGSKSVTSLLSGHISAEEDVCYPPSDDEQTQKGGIDFEDLDEFVAEERERQQAERVLRSPGMSGNGVPKIVTTGPTPDNRVHVDAVESEKPEEDDVKEEKDAEVRAAAGAGASSIAETVTPMNPRPFWTFFSSEMEDTVYSSSFPGLLSDGETARDLFTLQRPDDSVWWLDMLNPTEDQVTSICKAFGIHPLTREDITTQEMREKVELFRKYYFVCFRSFYQMDKKSENFLEPVNVYCVVFRQGVLTFSFCQNPHARNVRSRVGRLRDYMQLSADWICYALIDDIVDSFGPVIHDIESSVDEIEDSVLTARAEDSRTILRAIGDQRKKVMSLLRLLGGKADVIKGFAKRCNENYSIAPRGDVGMYLSDIQDHVVTMMGNLVAFEKMLSRSHANYLAQISVENLSSGNQVQETLGKVTLIGTVLVPLNLVTGLFGMNVNVPGKEAAGLTWWFGILGVLTGVVLVCLVVARRKKLI